MLRQQGERGSIPERIRDLSGICHVREHDRSKACFPNRFAGRTFRICNSAEKAQDGRWIYFDNHVWDEAVGLAMHRANRHRGRSLDETEPRSPLLVEPVSENPAGMIGLNLEVLLVEGRPGLGGDPLGVVAIQKDRHDPPPSYSLPRPTVTAQVDDTV